MYVYDYNLGSNVPIQAPPPNVIQGQGVAMPVPSPQVVGPQMGVQYVYVQDPMAELVNCTGVLIRQQPELFEAITGCETANRYHVFGESPQGLKYLFKCLEKSGFCERSCCPSNIREFDMEIYHILNVGQQMTKIFANIYKPLKCPCFCCNRPEIYLSLGTQKDLVGKIVNVFSCCDPEFEIFEKNGNLRYSVHADCCQCGIMCSNNVCGKFSTATFEIFDNQTKTQCGSITKMSAQSFSEVVTDADSYKITFPPQASAQEKLLIIALGLMIDYQYFETDSSEGRSSGGYGYRRRYGYGYGYGYGYRGYGYGYY